MSLREPETTDLLLWFARKRTCIIAYVAISVIAIITIRIQKSIIDCATTYSCFSRFLLDKAYNSE